MAELVDALVSGTSVSNDVQVRVLFWAQVKAKGKRQKTNTPYNFIFIPLSFISCGNAQMVELVDTLL
jgi:hypothetical protein